MKMHVLQTPRLELVPITLPLVEAVMLDRRADVVRLVDAHLPERWPGRALIERAFSASLERVRANPDERLWGDRLMVTREGERRLVGSVVFHGAPDADGVVEVGYGVEESSQGQGFGSEATCAMVDWALEQPGVTRVAATTLPWHKASIRILQKAGLRPAGWREHELLGDLQVFERVRVPVGALAQPRFVECRA
ncbi:MAG: GNAT family protein [Polyangiales bacterium]